MTKKKTTKTVKRSTKKQEPKPPPVLDLATMPVDLKIAALAQEVLALKQQVTMIFIALKAAMEALRAQGKEGNGASQKR